MQQWHEPVAGFEYRTHVLALTAETQAERLTACGVDPQVFGEDVDPAFFIGLAIHAGIDSGISAEGNINMLQRMIQHRPAKLDEPLTVRGEIQSVTWYPVACALQPMSGLKTPQANGSSVVRAPLSDPRATAPLQADRVPETGRSRSFLMSVSLLCWIDTI